ncbi:Protein bic1 [Salvia divinorum]|uniref:Protein bic1 n=1 Tax=Salvia divinorum TaxID=28513 RepID=A0ABD1GBX0_SALDI
MEKQIASSQGGESKLGHEKRRDRPSIAEAEAEAAESGRERLKRHRREVAGRVWIPDMWGQEDFLKDWIDSTVFDAAVRSGGITSARAALMDEGRRAAARIQNSC